MPVVDLTSHKVKNEKETPNEKTKMTPQVHIDWERHSNFPHEFQYVIQGQSSGEWVDSKYGANTSEEAVKFAQENGHKWVVVQPAKLRIVRAIKLKENYYE